MVGEVLDEPPVEISETKEGLHFSFTGRFWPVRHTRYFHRVHLNSVFRDNQSQVLNPGLFKLAFLGPEVQLVLHQPSEYQMGDLSVFFQVFRENENIVEINYHHAFRDHVSEDVIHHGLESGGVVSEPEKHHQRFEHPSVGPEGGLPLISFFDPHPHQTSSLVKYFALWSWLTNSDMSESGYLFFTVMSLSIR